MATLKPLQADALRVLRKKAAQTPETALTATELGMGLINCNFWNRLHGAGLIGRVTGQAEWKMFIKPEGVVALGAFEDLSSEAPAGA